MTKVFAVGRVVKGRVIFEKVMEVDGYELLSKMYAS